MSVDIRLPNITGKTDAEQLAQIKSYLYQFAGQLQWALKTVESGGSTNIVLQQGSSGKEVKQDVQASNFNQLKALIIKTADTVEAYEEKVDALLDLDGEYFAQSPFGDFYEATKNTVDANSRAIEQDLVSKQAIFDKDGNILAELLVNGHIYSGIIEYAKDGEAIVGIEIGQTTTTNGEKTFNKFARFTAEKLSFYDPASQVDPVAYISNYKLVITDAEITGDLEVSGKLKLGRNEEPGRFVLDTSNGIALSWEGGS